MKWFDRELNANGFFNGGEGIDNPDFSAIKVLLFYRAIQQACLGLLEYFYNYTPYQQDLDHLYNLCCNLWYFPNDIFPKFTKEDNKVYNIFMHSSYLVHNEGRSSMDLDGAYRYQERCKRFLDESGRVVRESFSNN